MKQRLTQKNLLFGLYWAGRNSLNPGLSIWFKDHYIYPRTRVKARVGKEAMLFQVSDPSQIDMSIGFQVLEASPDASAVKTVEIV